MATGSRRTVCSWSISAAGDGGAREVQGPDLLIADTDRDRLLAYSARIAAVTRGGLLAGRMPLAELLGPVFAEARERTRAKGDAAAENGPP